MLNRSQLDQVRTDKRQFFWSNSRSFSFASLGFGPADRSLVQSVYAFCRITDDLVDEHVADSQEAIDLGLNEWLSVARDAFLGNQLSGIRWLDGLMRESAARAVPFEIIESLVEGVRADANHAPLETIEELRSYCYGVASTVGLWMCHLFGVKDPLMLERAEALGRAMQLTNVLRDVGEDLGKGRVYLPGDILKTYDLSTGDLIRARETGTVPDRYDELIRHMMALADEDYERAWTAIPLLPATFARAAAVASAVYRGIHAEIIKNGYDNFTKRARTGSFRKIVLMLRALTRLWVKQFIYPRKRSLNPDVPPGKRLLTMRSKSILVALVSVVSLIAGRANAQTPEAIRDGVADIYWSGQHFDDIDSVQALLHAEPELRGDPVAVAYDAALEILKAKGTFWPIKKLEHVHTGLPVLDSLVTSHPGLVEPRYLRLLSCYFLPSLLKRQWSVEEDVRELAIRLPDARSQVSLDRYKKMLRFLLQNGHLDGTRDYDALMAALTAAYDEERTSKTGSSQ